MRQDPSCCSLSDRVIKLKLIKAFLVVCFVALLLAAHVLAQPHTVTHVCQHSTYTFTHLCQQSTRMATQTFVTRKWCAFAV